MKKILFLICCLISLTAFASTDFDMYLKSGHKSSNWDELVKAGFESFDSQNYSTAMIFLEKAYSKGCRDGLLLYKLGAYYELSGNSKKGLEFLTEASKAIQKQYPKSKYREEIPVLIGQLLFQMDKFKEAMPYIEEGLNSNPDDFMLNFMLGQIKRKTGSNDEARIFFEKAYRLTPTEDVKNAKYALLVELMTICYQLGDFESSLKYSEEILSQNPSDPAAQSYRNNINKKKMESKEKEMIKKYVQ